MRRVPFFLLLLFLAVSPALAQEADNAGLYQVTDVDVDVTSANASQARDQAVMQAQRSAFDQLLSRLGVDKTAIRQQDDDTIASLVQGFEVQQERTSAVRYIGVFTVQFKPNAVRAFLNKGGTSFTELRSKPTLILAVANVGGRNVLWEESTKWRAAWEEAARGSSVVPLILPSGDVDDATILSTADVVAGKAEAITALAEKYQANSVVVAFLKADPDVLQPQKKYDVEIVRYETDSSTPEITHYDFVTPPDANGIRNALPLWVRHIRGDMEKGWKQTAKEVRKGPVYHLPVSVVVESLPAWNAIRGKLSKVPLVSKMTLISLTRGEARVELEFYGTLTELNVALEQEGLSLSQPGFGEAWVLKLR